MHRSQADRHKEQQFEQLIAANKGVITKVCYMYATGQSHFKDLYQEVLINLWQSFDSFRGESAVSTWIYRVCINTCISCFRHSRHDRDNLSMSNPEMFALADFATDDQEHAACLKEMYTLINRLPALDKAIILMWLDEKSYVEISEVTGLHRNNVAARIHRCKLKLMKMSDS